MRRVRGTRSRREKTALAAEIMWTYVRVQRAQKRTDVRGVIRTVRDDMFQRRAGELSPDLAAGLGRAVQRTLTALPVDDRCLMQSLVLASMIARRGATATVVIGVQPGDEFGAHAWVELDGHAVLPSGTNEYQRLVEL